jgi:hypothetical protein
MMALSRQDAAAALHDIERAQARSACLEDYHRAAPHLMIWGVLWAVAYTLNDIYPLRAAAIWSVVVPIGVIAGLLAMRQGRNERTWRYAAMIGAIFIFVVATVVVIWPVNARQVAAFIPLLVALTYVLKGIWSGTRYVGLGIAVSAFTLLGFFLVKGHFYLWMAVVGGGSLILASLWFRRV